MGVILALQSSGAVHLGVDDLGVVRHVGRMLDDRPVPILFELVKDGDLLLLIDRMLRLRGPDTVRISKVKGHADEAMVLRGQVREVDRLGNNAADDAADFGRRRVGNAVIDARRNLFGVCNRWYPGGLVLLLLMPVVICLEFVLVGILFFLICIGSLLLSLELLLIMMGLVGLLLIRWSVLLVLCPRGEGLLMLFVTLLCFLDLLLFGLVNGLLVLLLLLMLMMSHSGLTLHSRSFA